LADANAVSAGPNAKGGTAFATTAITNSGAINSANDGIDGKASALDEAVSTGNATGGLAGAYVVISNSNSITSKADGIYGRAEADANAVSIGNSTGGVANAYTSISNSGAITSVEDGISGNATGNASASAENNGYGGTSEATVVITNSGSITVSDGDGIHGYALGNSSAYAGDAAHGGYAAASVTITNSSAGVIISEGHAINGTAYADANAHTEPSGESRYGTVDIAGTAIAMVVITNNASLTSFDGQGIHGYAGAFAQAGDRSDLNDTYTAIGGKAIATTTIVNTGAIRSSDVGIFGRAKANASAYATNNQTTVGNHTYSGNGTGGYASANVNISNSAPIVAGGDFGIHGVANTFSDGFGYFGNGGTASAAVTISNADTITAPNGVGIFGASFSGANGNLFVSFFPQRGLAYNSGAHGYGGTASAETIITNSGNVRNNGGNLYGTPDGGAITGVAVAYAWGVGYLTGTGGTAYASTVITNSGNLTSDVGTGLAGYARTAADALATGYHGVGQGGTAISFVDVNNRGQIVSYHDGIRADARAYAGAQRDLYGGPTGPNYSDRGGIAHAAVLVSNYGPLLSGEYGIRAFSRADASGFGGYHGIGGTAFAFTGVYNAAKIESHGTGISGVAIASADAGGGNGVFGSATAGVASAEVQIINAAGDGAFIKTYNDNSPGIFGSALAVATASGYGGKGGTASAETYIYNFATIVTKGDDSPGIKGQAFSNADGDDLTGTGGTAYSKVFIDNFGSITTFGDGADGIYAKSYAHTDGYTPGNATAVTVVQNFGSIVTHGEGAHGIDARAKAYGDAGAYTTVKNNGSILTTGPHSDGIKAYGAL